MKSAACFLLVSSALLCLVGCGDDNSTAAAPSSSSDAGVDAPDSSSDAASPDDSSASDSSDSSATDSSASDSSAPDSTPDSSAASDSALLDSSPVDSSSDSPSDSSMPDASDGAVGDGAVDASDAGQAKWSIATVDSSPKFKARVALALDKQQGVHLAYNVATDSGGLFLPSVWYAYPQASSWKLVEAAAAKGVGNEFPALAIDSADKAHITYDRKIVSESQVDLHYLSPTGLGTFASPKNLTNTSKVNESSSHLVFGSDGHLHILLHEKTANGSTIGIRYLSMAAGSIAANEVVASDASASAPELGTDLAIDSSGNAHVVYSRAGSVPDYSVLYYRKRTGNSWSKEERITGLDRDAWGPSIAVDSSGVVHLAYVDGADWDIKTLKYRSRSASWSSETKVSSSLEDRSNASSLAVDSSGRVHIAFSRLYDSKGDLFYVSGQKGVFSAEERVTQTTDADESYPSLAIGSSAKRFIAFVENAKTSPNGKVYLASKP